jgi:hypothetical protein
MPRRSTGAELGWMPFKEFADKYLEEVIPLMRSERSEAIRVRRWLRDLGSRPLGEITRAELETWQRETRLRCKPSTVNRELGRLRYMLNRAVDWGAVGTESNEGPEIPSGEQRSTTLSVAGGVRARIQACISPRVRAIVVIALHTGMRLWRDSQSPTL